MVNGIVYYVTLVITAQFGKTLVNASWKAAMSWKLASLYLQKCFVWRLLMSPTLGSQPSLYLVYILWQHFI